jgi:mannosyl-glycoprotein endo-beta-N-acetylglucosaminidase
MQVLGTFITEWNAGKDACRKLFVNENTAERTASQLTSIAKFYGFEGWIINIENEVDLDLIPNLLHFLR